MFALVHFFLQCQQLWPSTPSQPTKDWFSQTTAPSWPTGISIHSLCRTPLGALMSRCPFWVQRAFRLAFITGRWWCRRRRSGWSAWPARQSVAKAASRSSRAAASTASLCTTGTSTAPAPSPGPVSMSRASWRRWGCSWTTPKASSSSTTQTTCLGSTPTERNSPPRSSPTSALARVMLMARMCSHCESTQYAFKSCSPLWSQLSWQMNLSLMNPRVSRVSKDV